MTSSISDAVRGGLMPSRPDPPLPPGVPSAVIVPVIDEPVPRVLFTRRTDLVRDHKGEISFPGGVRHADDPDLLTTALRETEEELGIPREAFTILGALPPTHTIVSGYVIQPFVGLLAARPNMTPSTAEIAEVIEVELARLLRIEREVPAPGGFHATMHVFEAGPHVVWGATGRILHGFLEVLRGAGWISDDEEGMR